MKRNNDLQEQLNQLIEILEIKNILNQLWDLKFEKIIIETSIETAYNLVLPSILKKSDLKETYVPFKRPYLQKIWGYKSDDKLDPEQLLKQNVSIEKISEFMLDKIKYTIGGKLGIWNIKKFEKINLKNLSDEVIKQLKQGREFAYSINKFWLKKIWLVNIFDSELEYTNLDNFRYYKITTEYSNFIKHYLTLKNKNLNDVVNDSNKESFKKFEQNLREIYANANIDIVTIKSDLDFGLSDDEVLVIIPKYTLIGAKLIKIIEKEFVEAENNELKNKVKDLNLLHQKNSSVFNDIDKDVVGMPKQKKDVLITNLSKEINKILFPDKNYMDLNFLGSRKKEEIEDMKRIVEIRDELIKIKYEKEKNSWQRVKKLASAELLKRFMSENK